jgi:hypothetical protein
LGQAIDHYVIYYMNRATILSLVIMFMLFNWWSLRVYILYFLSIFIHYYMLILS